VFLVLTYEIGLALLEDVLGYISWFRFREFCAVGLAADLANVFMGKVEGLRG
jgi:hypothetical protein